MLDVFIISSCFFFPTLARVLCGWCFWRSPCLVPHTCHLLRSSESECSHECALLGYSAKGGRKSYHCFRRLELRGPGVRGRHKKDRHRGVSTTLLLVQDPARAPNNTHHRSAILASSFQSLSKTLRGSYLALRSLSLDAFDPNAASASTSPALR